MWLSGLEDAITRLEIPYLFSPELRQRGHECARHLDLYLILYLSYTLLGVRRCSTLCIMSTGDPGGNAERLARAMRQLRYPRDIDVERRVALWKFGS